MPKNNPNRNQPNYKVGGSHLNEYEFEQNKGEITEEEQRLPRNAGGEDSEATEHRSDSGRGGGSSSGING